MNKKVIVPVLATVMGLSVVGGISGTIAWYQFNTRASASFVATSVADGGTLQITDSSHVWSNKTNIIPATGSNSNKLIPVTFGEESFGADAALPEKVHRRPEAGVASTANWQAAEINKDYLQFKVYLRTMAVDQSVASGQKQIGGVPVYLSKVYLDVAGQGKDENFKNALRLHIKDNSQNGKNFLISNNGGDTNLYAPNGLDLDGDGNIDTPTKMAWEQPDSNPIQYGIEGAKHSSYAINSIIAPKVNGGDLQIGAGTKVIATTSASEDTELTLTVWLEGWELLNNNAIWNPFTTGGADIHVGVEFAVPHNAYIA